MEPIEGFADLQCAGTANPDDPCEGFTPKAKELTGLKVVDDHTFTIKTTEKVSNLPVRLGYSAFSPLPDVFFTDPKAFGDKPVGSGPYKLDSWTKEQSIVLSKFADYTGDFGGNVDKVTFKIYQDSDAAYNDVIANNLDVTDEIPASALIDDKYKTDLPDRNAQKESGTISTVTAAPSKRRPELRGPEDQAGHLDGDRPRDHHQADLQRHPRRPPPAGSPRSSTATRPSQCGEFCTYDPAKAKALLAEAGGFKGDKITLSYNADAAHKEWTEATCNSIKQALGVECQAVGVVDFATFRSQIGDRKMKGLFRTGWQMDYPSIENFLAPIFKTGCVLERRRLLQPGLRQAPRRRRGCHRPGCCQHQVPGGRGAPRDRTWPPSRCGTARPPWAGRTRSPV